jgi:hypothetical protein
MEGITFCKFKDVHLSREKAGIDASRIVSHLAFQVTRENEAEFGRVGKAGKVLRTAMRTVLINSADSRMGSRLIQSIIKVIHLDMVSDRELCTVLDDEADLLASLEATLEAN